MLKVLSIILSVIVVALGSIALITQNFALLPYMLFLVGIHSFILGIIELKKDRKAFWGYVNIGASVFVIFVGIYTVIPN
ncbi:DUF3953 domain-containing protein [Lentibacillus sp. Marseille-P4043]|uniref:DUF3953 domain-containing protein n=1 Tax=Lentibacillus sp. Marseille-P4043 TaxID=2040293 RepID=UPI000D0B86A1|nr:DUF3953 domain-containing protein [Lentibacillus sp. Marseille-P4043]